MTSRRLPSPSMVQGEEEEEEEHASVMGFRNCNTCFPVAPTVLTKGEKEWLSWKTVPSAVPVVIARAVWRAVVVVMGTV